MKTIRDMALANICIVVPNNWHLNKGMQTVQITTLPDNDANIETMRKMKSSTVHSNFKDEGVPDGHYHLIMRDVPVQVSYEVDEATGKQA